MSALITLTSWHCPGCRHDNDYDPEVPPGVYC